ncbi:DUF3365 domain-containing protein [Aetokthonos hydrillicola Thurmond2011]|uniref:histidine kinase n=1 Tax=Aetokthonos hydrillicola Thurmond2011 TaxID=2712845 RepID=A0AAP5M5X8_9CYAN|nr:DUF3365 domain-containing protein [Aetokthonos hydrillicola]MDR9896406.1 DUF3365 domain-containing protein [Aetokthonos hydrillicola Thurmond2011]
MKIGTKVNIILVIVFIGSILISSIALANVIRYKTEEEISNKAVILMEFANSVRQYTNDKVQPLLLPTIDSKKEFIPEAIPSFSVREVFDFLHRKQEYKNYIYKNATLNPTNLVDKADSFEADIVQKFRKDLSLKSLVGYRKLFGQQLFYSARPFVIEEPRCLRCHSTPEQAPKSQIATYGAENGFGWKLNDIIGTQIVYVPTQDVFKIFNQSFIQVIVVLGIIFTIITVTINSLLRRTVLRPIKKIAAVAEQVSIGNMDADFGKQSKDEIGALAEAFNRMKYSLEIALKILNNK